MRSGEAVSHPQQRWTPGGVAKLLLLVFALPLVLTSCSHSEAHGEESEEEGEKRHNDKIKEN